MFCGVGLRQRQRFLVRQMNAEGLLEQKHLFGHTRVNAVSQGCNSIVAGIAVLATTVSENSRMHSKEKIGNGGAY